MRTSVIATIATLILAIPASAASGQDAYAPLHLYEGSWALRRTGSDSTTKTTTIANACSRVGGYFACEQTVNGHKEGLLVFLPTEHPGHYLTQSLDANGNPAGRSELEIDGDHWSYRSHDDRSDTAVWYRTTNTFTGRDRIHFEQSVSSDAVHWRVVGSGDETRIAPPTPSSVGARGDTGARLGADTIDAYSRFFGNFRVTDARVVSVGRDDEGRAFLMDYASGVRRWLQARGDSLRGADGHRYSLRGGDTLVAMDDHGTIVWRGSRMPVRTEPLIVNNGGVHLEGTLWLPGGNGPFPAVVLVHGAGEETRYAMRQFPWFFVSRGYAVVTYDKRGSGKSTGDWHPWEAGIDALAGDALAVAGALRARSEIAGAKIGLMGISNGAWVIERAAARSPSVAFAIPISGGGVHIADSERFRLDRAAVTAGLSEADRAALARFLLDVYSPALLASDSSTAGRAVAARIHGARGTRWFALTPLTPFAEAPARVILDVGGRAWARELSYAADSDLARLRIPVLAISGAADQDVPARRNIDGIRNALRRAPNARLTTLLLPQASHALLLPPRDSAVDRFAPALFPTLGAWLDKLRD